MLVGWHRFDAKKFIYDDSIYGALLFVKIWTWWTHLITLFSPGLDNYVGKFIDQSVYVLSPTQR